MGMILESYLNENAFKNMDDFYFHYDDWKINTKNNLLFITGLSGSGKSTLASNIKKEKNAILISLDAVSRFISPKGNKFEIIPYSEDEQNILKIFRLKYKKTNNLNKELDNFFTFIFDYVNENTDKLFILEGIQIMNEHMANYIADNKIPTIVKGTSATMSFIRQIKRCIKYGSIKKGKGDNPFVSDKWLTIFRNCLIKKE